jgi:hypothetical protein
MGSEMPGPGADAPGAMHVAAPAARAWAIAAANAAVRMPVADGEAAAWTVRGWADVAVGCLALDGLVSLRLLGSAGIPGSGAELPWRASCPLSSARQLAWGARYRPSPSDAHRTVRPPVDRFLARRTWMCLPNRVGAGPAAGPVVAEVPSTASPLAQQIWRGIHEGAHLDHLSALTALGPAAPSPAEFGAGLMVAESYAMAVEILAAVECVLAEEGHAVWQLGAGLIERAARLPGGSDPSPEFTDLPTLAEVYVLGPLEVLTGGDATRALPAQIVGSLRSRWRSARAAYPPADAFESAAAGLLGRTSKVPGC